MEQAYGEDSFNNSSRLDRTCAARRDPPLLPDEVRRLLREEEKFTSRADVEVVGDLYARFFESVTLVVTHLNFKGLQWEDEQAHGLAVVLPSCGKLQKVRSWITVRPCTVLARDTLWRGATPVVLKCRAAHCVHSSI